MEVDPGVLIAAYVSLLYLIMGPVVLFGIYVLFDYFARRAKKRSGRGKSDRKKENIALWTGKDVWKNF